MNVKRLKLVPICFLTLGLVAILLPQSVSSQDDVPVKDAAKPFVEMYQINGDVKTAARLVQTVIEDPRSVRMEADLVTKRLIVVGSQESQRIIAAALAKFDLPVKAQKNLIRVFELQHIGIEDALQALARLSKKQLSMSADPRSNSIVVTGTQADTQLVSDLLAVLDVKAKNAPARENAERSACNIRVSWLVDPSAMAADDVKLLRKVPKHCGKVLTRLMDEDYLKEAALLTELLSLSQDDGRTEFQNTSFRNNLQSMPEARLQVSGVVKRLDDDRYSIRLQVGLNSSGTDYKFGSDFEVKAGHAVAFSLSDFNGVPSVWVIQLTPVAAN